MIMKEKYVITIDGPAGAGKSTIARQLAEKIKFQYVDTGAMYRALTLKLIREKTGFTDMKVIEPLVDKASVTIDYNGGSMHIFLDNEDVTKQIRMQKVTANTSRVARKQT
jgi:cytidylate kinase